MVVIQQMCGRIGMVTGKGLAGVIRAHYPKPVLYIAVSLLVITNTINIGADLGAMASSAQMLLGLPPLFFLLLITVVIIILEVFVSYKKYSKILKYLALTLFTYVLTAFISKPNWVFHDFSGFSLQTQGEFFAVFFPPCPKAFAKLRILQRIGCPSDVFFPQKFAVQVRKLFQLLLNIRKIRIGWFGFFYRNGGIE